MDLSMPGVNGIEAARKDPRRDLGTVVIILSGENDDVALARSIQAGARGYMARRRP